MMKMTHIEYLDAMIARHGKDAPIPDHFLTLGGLRDLYREIEQLEAEEKKLAALIDPRTNSERELDDLYTAQKETENSARPF